MTASSRKCAGKTRGRPFGPGNPGKPPGTRHRTTLAVEALLDGEAEGITRKAIELALEGDPTAMRLCLERVAPVRKGRPVSIVLPAAEKSEDIVEAFTAVTNAMAEGEITPDEAAVVASVLEARRRAIETVEIERRLQVLEQAMGDDRLMPSSSGSP